MNEVSIVDDHEQNKHLILETANDLSDQFNEQFGQQTIKSPIVNTGQVASIRNVITPNTRLSSAAKATTPSKVVNNIVLTAKNQSQLKNKSISNKSITIQSNKQPQQLQQQTSSSSLTQKSINLSPSQSNNQQILTKVIMTDGQQLLITSPIKQTNQLRTNETNNQEKQQQQQIIGLVPISPAKQQQQITSNKTTVQIRPKQSTSNLTIQSPTSNQTLDKQPQYQIIRLVSATNSNTTTNSTITTAGLKQISGTSGGQQKVLIPASALKNLNATQLLNQTGQLTTSTGGQQQILMYTTPSQLIQQSSNSTNPKQVTFSTASSNLLTSSSKSFVPILPNPSTNMNSTANKSISIQKASGIQNGPPKANAASANTDDLHHPAQNQSTNSAVAAANAQQAVASGSASNRPRKPCNCTRSQCLKLYCDCFANGEFCSNCNCINCFNNLDHEENRQKAIKQCLERNPHAFHPKIGKGKTAPQEGTQGIGVERRHTKGCNCRRSGCLKNYCECYEAKILCTDLCKCCACKNYEDSYERKSLMHLVDAVDIRSLHGTASSNFIGKENDPLWSNEFRRPKLPVPFLTDRLLSCSFITNDLVDATTQCLIIRAEKSQKLGLSSEEIERSIIDEFGNCLSQIIEVSKEKQKEK